MAVEEGFGRDRYDQCLDLQYGADGTAVRAFL